MNKSKSSIGFVGLSGLVFTDEDDVTYHVHIEKSVDEVVLLKRDIFEISTNKRLNGKNREIIISKIISLTPDIKWRIDASKK
jgi:phosphoribulokinase